MPYVFDDDDPFPSSSAMDSSNHEKSPFIFSLDEILTAQRREAQLKNDLIDTAVFRKVKILIDPLPINYPVAISPDPEPQVNAQRKRSKQLNTRKFFNVSRPKVLLNKLISDEFPNFPSSSNFKSPSDISNNDEICIELSVNRKSCIKKNSTKSPGDQIERNSTLNLPKFVCKNEQKSFESDEISILIESETNSNSIKKNLASSEKNLKINSDRMSTSLSPTEKLLELSRIKISPNSNEIFENIRPIFLRKRSPSVDQWENFDPHSTSNRSIKNFDNSCVLCQQIEKNRDEKNEFFDELLCADCRTPYKNWFMEPWKFVTVKCRCENILFCSVCRFWSCVKFVRDQIREYEKNNFHEKLVQPSSLLIEEIESIDIDRKFSPKIQEFGRPFNGYHRSVNGYKNFSSITKNDRIEFDSCRKSPKFRPFKIRKNKFISKNFVDDADRLDDDGPKVRYVCRRASLVVAQDPVEKSNEKNENFFNLSALPIEAKENILNFGRYEKIENDSPNVEKPLKLNGLLLTVKKAVTLLNNRSIDKTSSTLKRKRTKRCGNCIGCKSQDCNVCAFCLDKPRNGGQDVLHQTCIQRRCLTIWSNRLPSSTKKRRKTF